jgi:hypothetical protein
MALDGAVPVSLVLREIDGYSQHSMDSHIRPLTEAERRLVRRHLRRLERDRATHWPRVIGVTALVVGILWLLTVLASDAPLWVVTAFWSGLGIVLAVWVGRERGAADPSHTRELERALRHGSASVTRIEALRYAEIEEHEDEGAYLVLELPNRSLTFLSGQDSYPTLRFPSARIDYIDIRSPAGVPVLSTRSCKGKRLPLERTVPSDFKADMTWPGDLEVRAGTLADLEAVLLRDFTPER